MKFILGFTKNLLPQAVVFRPEPFGQSFPLSGAEPIQRRQFVGGSGRLVNHEENLGDGTAGFHCMSIFIHGDEDFGYLPFFRPMGDEVGVPKDGGQQGLLPLIHADGGWASSDPAVRTA